MALPQDGGNERAERGDTHTYTHSHTNGRIKFNYNVKMFVDMFRRFSEACSRCVFLPLAATAAAVVVAALASAVRLPHAVALAAAWLTCGRWVEWVRKINIHPGVFVTLSQCCTCVSVPFPAFDRKEQQPSTGVENDFGEGWCVDGQQKKKLPLGRITARTQQIQFDDK